MAKDYSTVLYDVDGVVARITLNRPEKRNALNEELIAALKEALRRANDKEDVRVVIVTGAGAGVGGWIRFSFSLRHGARRAFGAIWFSRGEDWIRSSDGHGNPAAQHFREAGFRAFNSWYRDW